MKTLKKMAALAAVASIASLSMTANLTASAADEIGQAYFIGSFGTASNWEAGENEYASVTSIDGDATYAVNWTFDSDTATDTGDSWFLCICIYPSGTTENFTTDSLPDLEVTLDTLTIDGTEYDTTGATVNTAYYEGDPGVTRIYIHDDWSGSGATELVDDCSVTSEIYAEFTISGTGQTGTSNINEDGTLDSVTADTASDDTSSEDESTDDTSSVSVSSSSDTSDTDEDTDTEDTDDTSDATTTDDTESTSTTSETGDAGVAAVCVAAVAAAALGVVTMRSRKK